MAAATQVTILTRVKNRLGISDTTFDTQLNDFIVSSVARLWPLAANEVAAQTTVPATDTFGEANISLANLSTPVQDVRLVEAFDGSIYFPADQIYRHGTNLRVRNLSSAVSQLKIYGLTPYVLHATVSANTTLPEHLELPVMWYTISEFYEFLTGSKSYYNIYMQQSGARAVDNMRDEALFYEQRADAYLENKVAPYGAQ